MPVVDSVANQEATLMHIVKKRRLCRNASSDSVVWFPHDNHPRFLQELVSECNTPAVSIMVRQPQAQAPAQARSGIQSDPAPAGRGS